MKSKRIKSRSTKFRGTEFRSISVGKLLRNRFCQLLLFVFLVLNIFAFAGAYGMTHYHSPGQRAFGLLRPVDSRSPAAISLNYRQQRIAINASEWLESWLIPADAPAGTVLLFPGKGGSKSDLLAPARVFHDLGYQALLVDFRGVGGSSGNTSTLGMREARDVAVAMRYAQETQLQPPLILYGVSMGSAAIMRAIAQEKINPDAAILELPFARLMDTVGSRLKSAKLPAFPVAQLIVFWGSLQHRYNGFAHNPVADARRVQCPTLVMHGKLDQWTTVAEINQIFKNLPGTKQLAIFPDAGHQLLVTVDKELWRRSAERILSER
jgi:uncharacterized protein